MENSKFLSRRQAYKRQDGYLFSAGPTENSRPENYEVENDGRTFSNLRPKLRSPENAGLKMTYRAN